jgi:formylglycine-generating enzyme required for sulfatase activity
MLFRKGIMLLSILAVIGCFAGCGKKSEEKGTEATTETAAPESVKMGDVVLIPGGEYAMGTDDKESQAYPIHKVNLPAFWIDKYEVTNFEFRDFSIKEKYAGEGVKSGKDWRALATFDKAKVPVVFITWGDADAYCKAAGKRLPTEEEWEAAARGPQGFRYPWGNDWIDGRSNTAEIGLLKQVDIGKYDDVSPFGVHDMLGNAREWTSTWFSSYPGNPKRDPMSGKQRRIVRGLSPNHKGKMAHLWDRDAMPPDYLGDPGFRCAKDATPEEAAKAKPAK